MSPHRLIASVLVLTIGTIVAGCSDNDPETIGATPQIEILSSKAEHVTGGDALLDVSVPGNATPTITVTVNGVDAPSTFSASSARPGHLIGRVTGLGNGLNTIVVKSDGAIQTFVLTNYPITGPMLSGPHIAPFVCQTQSFNLPGGGTLGPATDAACSAPTVVRYMYRPSTGGALQAMASTTALPADVGMTTTTDGRTVPFVVRIETGTMNRGIYQNAILHDPTKDPSPTPNSPPPGWNKRLIAVHGTGCVTGWYLQGAAMGVSPYTDATNLTRLGEGYAVFTNTLNHPTNSCNATLAGETTMMGKERFIETFGVPAFTVSRGTSGGAYTSLQVADSFPGLFDGIFFDATFPDALSIALSALDSRLLARYHLANPGSFSDAAMVTVSGHKGLSAWYDLALQAGRTDPVPARVDANPIPPSALLGGYGSGLFQAAVPAATRYHPTTNPTGARPTVFDAARNIYGVDPATGFALRPFDNVGVQYGLAALNAGTITKTQFLNLNEVIGGYDQDANFVAARSIGSDKAIRRAYQSGLNLNGNAGLASIPVFDTSAIFDDDQLYHYQWFHFATRERMAQANGDTRNHVMWRGGASILAAFGAPVPAEQTAVGAAVTAQAWPAFISWVSAYKADTTSASQRNKVITNKPAAATDGCFTFSTTPTFVPEAQTFSRLPDSTCNTAWPSYSFPRKEAGGPLAANILKCQLKPVDVADYSVTFTGPELARLSTIFPQGVCDWSKPGVNQTGTIAYGSFGPSPVNAVP